MELLRLENQFQMLLAKLHRLKSDGLHLTIIINFLQQIKSGENNRAYTSYYQQLLPFLFNAINEDTLKFRSPEFLAFLGSQIAIIETLKISTPEKCRRYRKLIATAQEELAINLGEHKAAATGQRPKDYNSKTIHALLVERNEQVLPETPRGVIKPLSFEIRESTEDSVKDVIQFRFNCEDQFHKMHNQALNSLIITKNILSKQSIEKNRQDFFQLFYSFGGSAHNYAGESLGFGMGLLNIANLSEMLPVRFKYLLKNDFVLTGAMYENGDLLPISSLSLKEKLKAFFYSPFQKVVIPEMNQLEAEEFLKELSQKYPNRQYRILSFKNIKETLNNEDIFVKEKKYNTLEFLKKSKKIRKYSGITIITFFFLLVFLIKFDRNPHNCDMLGQYFQVYNSSGRLLWKYNLGIPTNLFHYRILDVNNDSNNEVIMGISDKNKLSGTLYFFDNKGHLKWKFDNHQKKFFGDSEFSDQYSARSIYTCDFDQDGYQEIITSFVNRPYYPCRLMQFDIDGNILGDYWQSGHVNSINFMDIDEDGVKEIFFAGTNNQYNDGVFGILEHDQMIGHTPQTAFEYTPQNIPKGQQILYMKFDMPEDISDQYLRGKVRDIVISKDSTIEFSYRSGVLKNQGAIRFDFNKKMELLRYTIGDLFLAKYHKIYNRNLQNIHTDAELTNYQFWDGEKWVDEVVFKR